MEKTNKINNQKSVASLLRQWQLLQLLPARGPGSTVTELLEKLQSDFVVERRTIERDLDALSSIFPIHSNDKSKPYGWHWGGSQQFPSMSLQEAVLLQLAEPMLTQLLPDVVSDVLSPKINEAKRIIAKSQQQKTLRLSEKLALVGGPQLQRPPVIDPVVLSTLQTALFEDKCADVSYLSPYSVAERQTLSQWVLHPLALVQTGVQLYLVAIVDGHQDVRLFALHRFRSAAMLNKAAERPAQFDLQAYLASGAMQFLSGGIVELKAKVVAKLAKLLEEAPLSDDMQLDHTDPSRPVMTATVQDSWNLRMWLLSQGNSIEVLSPASLRTQIINELTDTLALYQS